MPQREETVEEETVIRYLATLALLASASAANAQSPDFCDYREARAACTADLVLDEEKGEYTVSAPGQCLKITVTVDGAPHEHLLPAGGSASEQLASTGDPKEHEVAVSSCAMYPSKTARVYECSPAVVDATNRCRIDGMKAYSQCNAAAADGKGPADCEEQALQATEKCFAAAAEIGNQCLHANAFSAVRDGKGVRIVRQTSYTLQQ